MHSRAFSGPEIVFLEGTVQLIENKHCLRNRKFTCHKKLLFTGLEFYKLCQLKSQLHT